MCPCRPLRRLRGLVGAPENTIDAILQAAL